MAADQLAAPRDESAPELALRLRATFLRRWADLVADQTLHDETRTDRIETARMEANEGIAALDEAWHQAVDQVRLHPDQAASFAVFVGSDTTTNPDRFQRA